MTQTKNPRRFRVWLDRRLTGAAISYERVVMPAGSTDRQCDEACEDCLNTMLENELDTGWEEIS
jgi:hypothetical protein